MRKTLPFFTACLLTVLTFTSAAATAASGPQTAWNVFTLPNPTVTPNWRSYGLGNCDACADDTRFWEDWDFTSFSDAIAKSFTAVSSQGQYQSVMLLMALGDVEPPAGETNYFRGNLQLMYATAANPGLHVPAIAIEPVLFPKWKYGAEWCYLYPANAPSKYCQIAPGSATGEALAHQKLLQLMDYVQSLGGGCANPGTFNSGFAIWYGWPKSEFPYQGKQGQVLKTFWKTLPTGGTSSGCNLQASYIPWLDSGYGPNGSQYVNSPDVHNLQTYVEQTGAQLYVDTELYSQAQIQQYGNTFHNQTIITGYWNAPDITTWAKGMCAQWNAASQPVRLGVWTFADRDVDPPYELYRSYIKGEMAVVGNICSY